MTGYDVMRAFHEERSQMMSAFANFIFTTPHGPVVFSNNEIDRTHNNSPEGEAWLQSQLDGLKRQAAS